MENNIRKLRRERGWSMEKLAELVEGKPHFTTIAKLERSQRPLSTDWMTKIAKALQVDPVDLIAANDRSAIRKVPLIGQIAAGAWREAIQTADEFVIAPCGGSNVFALRPQGDSMNRVIMEGAYVLIDPDQLDLIEGKVYAVRNESGEATLKIYRSSPPRLEPASTNLDHQPIHFGREAFTVIGRVIWQGMEL